MGKGWNRYSPTLTHLNIARLTCLNATRIRHANLASTIPPRSPHTGVQAFLETVCTSPFPRTVYFSQRNGSISSSLSRETTIIFDLDHSAYFYGLEYLWAVCRMLQMSVIVLMLRAIAPHLQEWAQYGCVVHSQPSSHPLPIQPAIQAPCVQ